MTSKERAELRGQANTIDTTLIVGKGGISDTLIAEAEKLLDCHELVKGKVLEASLLSAAEACQALCEQTGAEGIQVVGSKFVIYRRSEKKEQEKKTAAKALSVKPAPKKSGRDNPVKKGIRERKELHRKQKQLRDEYFHQAAVKAAIERRKQRESGE